MPKPGLPEHKLLFTQKSTLFDSNISLISELTKETFGPLLSRKTEQALLDIRNALCTNPRFREEIVKLRVRLADVNYDNLCEDVATHHLCENWRLSGGEKWIAWLIKNWDPETFQLPPHESSVMSNSFYPWTIRIEYLNADGQPGIGIGIKATVSLNAGVSKKEAVSATKLAIKKLNPEKGRSGRPSISDIDRAELRNIFERQGLPKGRNRSQRIKAARDEMQNLKRLISLGVVGREYRHWLKEKGLRVKNYGK